MSKRAATPVRFDTAVAERLSSFVAANPGMSLSSAANRLVDEALRMSEHPESCSGQDLPGGALAWSLVPTCGKSCEQLSQPGHMSLAWPKTSCSP